jgi:hypothetical protein
VAATVIWYAPAGVPVTVGGPGVPPPLQPTANNANKTIAVAAPTAIAFLSLVVSTSTRDSIMKPNTAAKSHSAGPMTGVTKADDRAVVVSVRVVLTGAPFGVTVDGEKLQVLAAGSPAQEKVVAELKPADGEIVMVNVPVWPAANVALLGCVAIEKSPPGLPATILVLVRAGSKVASPSY